MKEQRVLRTYEIIILESLKRVAALWPPQLLRRGLIGGTGGRNRGKYFKVSAR